MYQGSEEIFMAGVREQTMWLRESLPNCQHVYLSADVDWPKWLIVRFYVSPEEATPDHMQKTIWHEDNRTRALLKSKSIAKAEDKASSEKEHKGVWKIERDGNVFYQTIWPEGF